MDDTFANVTCRRCNDEHRISQSAMTKPQGAVAPPRWIAQWGHALSQPVVMVAAQIITTGRENQKIRFSLPSTREQKMRSKIGKQDNWSFCVFLSLKVLGLACDRLLAEWRQI